MENVPVYVMPSVPMTEIVKPGYLYVVATPIGNLGDITLRALQILGSVDRVAAEDTRTTARLLAHFGIHKPLISLHEHNESRRLESIVQALRQGESLALVSDAGTPTLSDPGFVLARRVISEGLPLVPIPGASAAMALMSVAGLPTDTFTFCGFPPKKAGRRRRWIEGFAGSVSPLIFYVSPHSITGFLGELRDVLGDRQAVLGREMTKMFEEFLRGSLSELEDRLSERDRIRGECSLMVAGAEEGCLSGEISGEIKAEDVDRAITKNLAESQVKPSALAKRLSRELGMDRQYLYARILSVKGEDG
ncbi:16S rRNA (cytidine(1402)-2'-O)-methyltransferase [Desulfobotulus sp. H1]|uniref:Ribosomal RNA small subunit methyltransferase I n=1 Tax=Desulfobotulus pelophilus TaxID=2823377 RepID=A0ABT3NAP4_9BACT|nr:16S rRNA (cytidine(1402)-2'-O)-methyltransferase [Desulfobotulus pelophilus]MCW7754535.1 16S rRNA (cytidine(1402)-2'-O)-methyltransferase [Desulfobotulus pelophilus]